MAHTLRIDMELARHLRDDDPRLLARAVARLDVVQLAAQLDNMAPAEQQRVLQNLHPDRRADVFGYLRDEVAVGIIERVAPDDAAALLEDQESDDIVDILGELEPKRLREILARFDPEDVDELQELLAYDEESAGGIMSPDFVSISSDARVGELLQALRSLDDPPAQMFSSYVLDDEGRLVGIVSLRALVLGQLEAEIRSVMRTEVVSVLPGADQEEVADIASRYDLVAVPVVDDQRRMLGVVTIDDIVDVLQEEATEDILKMAGAGEELSETREFLASFRARLPWLAAAAIGGLLVAFSLTGFEGALQNVPALALFMPVIAGMGGNVGTQSSTIVVRGLAVGYVERSMLASLVLREMALGAALGLVYGVAIALSAPFIGATVGDPVGLGIVLTLGMVGSMTIATTVGSSIPLLMERAGIDPALSTGPFVTTAVDILGLLFYFWLATVFLGVSV
jgi:magnesium transporter